MARKLPPEIERKFGMIKALGIEVYAYYDGLAEKWNINLGNEATAYVTEDGLEEYVDIELHEIRNKI